MCRLLAYTGPPVVLDELLYKPEHSIIKQSYHAVEMDEPLNGDGFGIGWYNREVDPDPAVFSSVQPAWNNQNLQYMAPKLTSDCVFAHVRAASVGGVNPQNCHPFHHRNFLMMHNGGVDHFRQIRRPLLARLSDPQFHAIGGQTDSEHIFALFLEQLAGREAEQSLQAYIDALRSTVDIIMELKAGEGLDADARLNLLVTDGQRIAGSRLAMGSREPLTLYYATGDRYECENNRYSLREQADSNGEEKAVLLASERLNEHTQEWKTVPDGHYFGVSVKGDIQFYEV